jgi:carbonic anhydrase/acetyltransferase-like protein (isoleucine patch superfamily)
MPIFISPINGKKPRISPNAFIAENATIIGDVIIESGANIWYNAVLRGDYCTIKVGKNTSIQDNVTLHSTNGTTCEIHDHVVVGHNAIVHGPCVVDSLALIGMNSSILENTTVGRGAVIAGGATARKEIPPMALMVGTPATVKKIRTEEETAETMQNALTYVSNGKKYRDSGRNHPGLESYLDPSI